MNNLTWAHCYLLHLGEAQEHISRTMPCFWRDWDDKTCLLGVLSQALRILLMWLHYELCSITNNSFSKILFCVDRKGKTGVAETNFTLCLILTCIVTCNSASLKFCLIDCVVMIFWRKQKTWWLLFYWTWGIPFKNVV